MNQLIELQNEINNRTKELLKKKEVFLTIKDHPKYAVSNLGRVKNLKTERILKPNLSGDGYHAVSLCIDGIAQTMKIHQLVANAFLLNIENKRHVDHIDHNELNNNLQNLRFATIPENNRNRRKQQKPSSSKYKGVSLLKATKKYQVRISLNGKQMSLGLFDTEEEGAHAYNQKALEHFGEYANINIIIDV